ncbi:MAG: oxidoreductase [Gammaproteobacteria bacterium]|nr:oxidoreductase [Gammaproteobacteria bacterium]MBJ55302.1 oxidoreductase [Gammaproteobacteria bacterium]HBN15709.1 oxidoreductase [Pseudohongiella sp.]
MLSQYSLAALLTALYLVMTWYCFRHTTVRRASTGEPGKQSYELVLGYASQGGTAEALAHQYASMLPGVTPTTVLPLNALTHQVLERSKKVLFFVSTYGEGEAPDNGLRFERYWRNQTANNLLTHLEFAVLALGDSQYQKFCGFGNSIAQLMNRQGARPMFEPVQVDRSDTQALELWRKQLTVTDLLSAGAANTLEAAEDQIGNSPGSAQWNLSDRRLLNAGSPGNPLYLLSFKCQGGLPNWQAGDIARIWPFDDRSQLPREYSIASVPDNGVLTLVVRLAQRDDGSPGICSSWLTDQLSQTESVRIDIRKNRAFHAAPEAQPLILIGNGSGIAGLLAHLEEQHSNSQHGHWLIYGERSPDCDRILDEQLTAWCATGHLDTLLRAFSRSDNPAYVQDLIRSNADQLRAVVKNGAQIMVCGSRLGMAPAVDAALSQALGSDTMQELATTGRYRRDIY